MEGGTTPSADSPKVSGEPQDLSLHINPEYALRGVPVSFRQTILDRSLCPFSAECVR